MKIGVVAYLLFGAWLIGGAEGIHQAKCPGEESTATELAIQTVTWPVYVFGAMTYAQHKTGVSPCKPRID